MTIKVLQRGFIILLLNGKREVILSQSALRAIFLLVLFISVSSANDQNFSRIYEDINAAYDLQHPLPLHLSLSQLKSHHHFKRCILISPEKAIESYLNKEYSSYSQGKNILVNSPCLGSDSLGNYLGSYFENIVCAELSGLHYLSVGKIYEPKTKHVSSAFISNLPNYIENKNPIDHETSRKLIKTYCKCEKSCHEQKNAAWVSGLNIIKPIFKNALLAHLNIHPEQNQTVVKVNDISTEPINTVLPLIPDVAIHYRCGDNFVGYYGFLPFSVFKDKIPNNTKTIYVLAERRGRKTVADLAEKCDSILLSLKGFLSKNFPNSKILLKRGDNLYTDMARLSFAKTVFCSASTFCLWPAVTNDNTVYFPKTKLIVGGDTNINLGSGSKIHLNPDPSFIFVSPPTINFVFGK